MPASTKTTRILVTGATGFVGSHLLDLLLMRPALEIHATRRWSARMTLVEHIRDIERIVTWHTCDLTDPFSVDAVIEASRPEIIYHLGAQSFVSPSWTSPELYFRTNVLGTLFLLEALRRHQLAGTTVLIPGSGEEYGDVPESELPIRPETPLRPLNPYAVSKVAQDLLGFEHHRSYGLRVVRLRAFNHEGPRRDRVFALPSFAWQIARIEAGIQEPVVRVGNLQATRNWTDVRDMVVAYCLAAEKCPPGQLFLVGSDQVLTVRDCLTCLISMSPQAARIHIEESRDLVRPTEPLRLIADWEPFRTVTGWKPTYTIEQTLRDTLEYWRSVVARGA